jgi:PAS domain S-box-containing protein
MATQQKSLVLILARGLADELASAMFVVDQNGTLAYFNESAEAILGQSFPDTGEMSAEEWATAFVATDHDGRPLPREELPIMIALNDRVPAHRGLRVEAADGEARDIAVTAFPLFARKEELVGAVAIFWEQENAAKASVSALPGARA